MTYKPAEFKALQNGDPAQLERLYHTIKHPIYQYLLGKTKGNREYADEIFSETVASIISSISSLKNQKNIKSWVYLIATRRYHDFFRNHFKAGSGTAWNEELTVDDRNPSPQEQMEQQQELTLFECGMNSLPEHYSNVLKLKYDKDWTLNQIAESLSQKRGAVESMIVRAKNRLKKEMEKCEKQLKKLLNGDSRGSKSPMMSTIENGGTP